MWLNNYDDGSDVVGIPVFQVWFDMTNGSIF